MSIADEIIRLKNAKENIKTAIENKGVEVSDSLTISDYAELISGISQSNNDLIKSMIERTATDLDIPNYVTSIGGYAFYNCTGLTSVTIPDSVTSIGSSAFNSCKGLTDISIGNSVTSIANNMFLNCIRLNNVTIPNSVTYIGSQAFFQCTSITSVTIPNSVTSIGDGAFNSCTSLTNATIPNSITSIKGNMFPNCTSLTYVTIKQGFNANNLNLSASTLYSVETIVSWLEALADRTGLSTYTLTIGTTNLAKLTEEQIAIATAKNWTLA